MVNDQVLRSKTLGVIGDPIDHSLSPLMHNTAIAALGLNYTYLAFAVSSEDLAEAVKGMRALGMVGWNITIPHKESILPYLHELTDEARLIGAVNTVRREGKKLVGHNTDGIGLLTSLRQEGDFDPVGKRCVILGAGGAARAVAVQLALVGAGSICIGNRTVKRAEALAAYVRARVPNVEVVASSLAPDMLREPVAKADLVINTTSVGMQDATSTPVPGNLLSSGQLVCDIVYRPLRTLLLQEARQQGARILDGLGMLIYQGSAAFHWWTGQAFPVPRVRQALTDYLAAAEQQPTAL